jgi:hypothetical protein
MGSAAGNKLAVSAGSGPLGDSAHGKVTDTQSSKVIGTYASHVPDIGDAPLR